MSGIEKITERILADAREQAEANRAEAAGKAKEILAAGDALAEKKRQAILDQAKAEEIELHKRRQAVCDLEMRKDTLQAKRRGDGCGVPGGRGGPGGNFRPGI